MKNIKERLLEIREMCEGLLDISKGRTQGGWQALPPEVHRDYVRIRGTRLGDRYKIANVCGNVLNGDVNKQLAEEPLRNADFIAACAGPAEAGWRATISMIDKVIPRLDKQELFAGYVAQGIIEAWKEVE